MPTAEVNRPRLPNGLPECPSELLGILEADQETKGRQVRFDVSQLNDLSSIYCRRPSLLFATEFSMRSIWLAVLGLAVSASASADQVDFL